MPKIPTSVRILTILGLVFQGIGVVLTSALFLIVARLPRFFMMVLEEAFVTADELNAFFEVLPIIRIISVVVIVIQLAFFIVNMFLFIPVLKEKKTVEQASTIFLYQAIYGGITLFSNQLVGVVHLISGIIGRNKMEQASEPIRDGI